MLYNLYINRKPQNSYVPTTEKVWIFIAVKHNLQNVPKVFEP